MPRGKDDSCAASTGSRIKGRRGGGEKKKKRKGAGREQTAITVSGLIKRPSRMEAILILADAFKAATGAHELM